METIKKLKSRRGIPFLVLEVGDVVEHVVRAAPSRLVHKHMYHKTPGTKRPGVNKAEQTVHK